MEEPNESQLWFPGSVLLTLVAQVKPFTSFHFSPILEVVSVARWQNGCQLTPPVMDTLPSLLQLRVGT